MKLSMNHQKLTNFVIIVSTMLCVMSCSSTKNKTIIWVHSMKSECSSSAGIKQCLLIHRGDSLDNPNWELFYSPIDDFNFETGYFQKIEILEESIDKSSIPADASSRRYTLIKTLDKQIDRSYLLNDTWVPIRIFGNPVNKKISMPRMELNMSKMQVFGTNGCNNYRGKIKIFTSTHIQFSNIGTTKKMCLDMNSSNSYDIALKKTRYYKLGNLELTFLDDSGNETVSFKKVD
ncbi:MAG: DUF4377 domain-containing protein [Flavobacteriaceae bacterium]